MDKTTIATIAAGTAVVTSSVDNVITRHKLKKLEKETKRLKRSIKIGRLVNISLETMTIVDIAYKAMSHSSLNKKFEDLQQDLVTVNNKYDEINEKINTVASEHNISDRLAKVESDVKLSKDIEDLKNRTDFLKSVLDRNGLTQPMTPPPPQPNNAENGNN